MPSTRKDKHLNRSFKWRIYLDHGEAYENFGDDAMLIAAHDRIRRAFDGDVDFIVPCREGGRLPELSNVQYTVSTREVIPDVVSKLYNRWWARFAFTLRQPYLLERWIACQRRLLSKTKSWTHLTGVLKECDACYAVGCGNMNDVAPHVTLLYRLSLALECKVRMVPLITSSQGLGPFQYQWSVRVAGKIKRLSDHFSLRYPLVNCGDRRSLRVLEKDALVVGDEAHGLALAGAEGCRLKLDSIGHEWGNPYLVVHYREAGYTGSTESALEKLAQAFDALDFAGDYIFVPMSEGSHSGSDADCGMRIKRRMRHGDRLRVLTGNRDPRFAKSLVWHSSGVIALSYHLQVFAFGGGIPFIILTQGAYYRSKAEGMRNLAGSMTPVVDAEKATIPVIERALGSWMQSRAGQVAQIEASRRRVKAVNDQPVWDLIKILRKNDKVPTKR